MAIFPKLCFWRRSLCSNLGGIDPEKLYRATLTRQFSCLSYGRACFKVLPRILCFNTMRYAFNMVTMMKEKVNTHFSFPLQLNMAPYTEDFLMGDLQDQGIETCNFVVLIFGVLDVLVSKGWRCGGSTCLPPMWPMFKSQRRRLMWVEFVVCSLPCSGRFFFGYSGFPLFSETNISKFQFDQDQVDEEPRRGCATSSNRYLLFIWPCQRRCKHCSPIHEFRLLIVLLTVWISNLRRQ